MTSSNWQTIPLGDICEGIYDGPHATPKKIDHGPIFLGISNLSGGRLDLSDTNHLSEKDFKKWTRRVTPQPDDIVFSYETRLGEAALIPEGLRCCLGRRMGLLRLDKTKVDPRFILYTYLGPEFQHTIEARTIYGSTVNRIALTELPSFPIKIPPLSEQRAIAHILGTLDDKIELNRRMNATLEAMARAIFKSWFVDFDPVHAKARGEQPIGMDADTAALFPDSFEESELGPIPREWRISKIGQEVEAVGGSTPSTSNPSYWEDGDIYWTTPKDLSSLGSPLLLDTERKITEAGLARISSGLLPVGTVLMSSRAPVGYLAIAEIPVAINQGYIAMICNKKLSNHYVLFWCEANMSTIKGLSGGTTFNEINKRNFRPIDVLVPPDDVIAAFDRMIDPLYQRLVLNLRESRTLAELRDTLLPKLISGELRVPEVDNWHAFIERTAGSLADDPIHRWPQGDYEERDALE